jgi:cation diffusion facilitator CzcD-associated flavoprotein CzcO
VFSQGAEIRDYWQSVAKKHGLYEKAKFGHRVQDTEWQEQDGKWRVTSQELESNVSHVEEYDFIITAIGRFNHWRLPDYPGIDEYKGVLRHASNWDSSFDPTGKRVAVIGNGASGIQLVTSLQKVVGHLDNYARNKTWIAGSWAGDAREAGPQLIPEELKKTFKNDPQAYLTYRKTIEDKYWRNFPAFLRGSELNANLTAASTKLMKERLSKNLQLAEELIPDFPPNCRRLTPGPGYLEAITESNVDYIRTPIKRFTETGVETVDGQHREVDAIFCATGHNVDMVPPFPIRANGKNIQDLWAPDGEFGSPYTYLGLSTPGFPNFLFIGGPQAIGGSGTVPQGTEVQVTYLAKVLRKVSKEGIKSIVPKQDATDDFIEYADAFFAKTVLSENCSSWYNGGRPGSRIHGLWPGSAAHVTQVRREPRWEDFEYEYLGGEKNRFWWYLGNGLTAKELDPESDITSYLKLPAEIDLRKAHEGWWDLP